MSPLMDVSMPHCKATRLPGRCGATRVPIGLQSLPIPAFDKIQVRRHLTDSEFDDYVQKGWPPGQLVALITKLDRLWGDPAAVPYRQASFW
ncbi:hypothetical protein AB6809_36000 [Paraburkholderia sp. RCC_158]